MSAESPKQWISVPMAAKHLGIGERAVNRLVESGQLTCRSIPPSYRRVLRSEVEALASRSTTPARSA